MAPAAVAQALLSPAELSYLHDSLSLTPPVRPDGRTPTEFRPLTAETDILPGTNGSARVCFVDGTEAIVGVKAQVERSHLRPAAGERGVAVGAEADNGADEDGRPAQAHAGRGDNSWVEMSIELPGYRDDDNLPIFLAAMLVEALLASGELKDRLWINRRFHWKLYIDVRFRSQLTLPGSADFEDPTYFATPVISIAVALHHCSSGFALCQTSAVEVRAR